MDTTTTCSSWTTCTGPTAPRCALLGRLLRHPPDGQVLLALAYRPRQAPAHLLDLVAEAGRAGTVELLDLSPLSLPEAEELVGVSGHRPCLWTIYRHSGGNPRYLRMLTREEPEPSIEAELAELGVVARRVAQAAAVLAGPFDPKIIAEVADLPQPIVLAALDELARADLIRSAGGGLAFRHELIGRIAYQSADPGWRLGAHARADAALAGRGASTVDRADHVVHTAVPGDLDASRILADAARAMRFRAPERAATWLRVAVRVLPDRDAARPRLMLDLARAIALSGGSLKDSRDTLDAILPLLPGEPDPLRERVVRWYGTIERLLGRRAEARARVLETVSLVPDDAGPEAAALRLELAAGELLRGKVTDGLEWGEQALRAIQGHDDPIAEATALAILALGTCFDGGLGADRSFSLARVDRAAELIDAVADDRLTARADAVVWLAWSEILHERHRDAIRHAERALRLVEPAELRYMVPHLLTARVMALSDLGRLTRARACCDEAIKSGLMSDMDDAQTIMLAVRCSVATWIDGVDEALSLGEAAVARPASGYVRALAVRMLAEARLAAGDPAGCLAMIRYVGGPELPETGACARPGWYELLTRAELARDRPDDAGGWAGRALVAAGRIGLPGKRGLAQLAGAQVLGALDPAAAVPSAVAAADALGSAGLHLGAARARLLTGSLLAESGAHDRARAELTAARTAAESCGATLLVRQVTGQQRRLAARFGRHRGPGPAPLTRREREVAGLVAEGLTNRKIAGRLFVSEKTVEMHVSRIIAKLGVPTRAAVAGALAREN